MNILFGKQLFRVLSVWSSAWVDHLARVHLFRPRLTSLFLGFIWLGQDSFIYVGVWLSHQGWNCLAGRLDCTVLVLILLGQGLIIREGLLAFWGVRVNLRGLIIKSFDMGRIIFFFFGLDYANYAKNKSHTPQQTFYFFASFSQTQTYNYRILCCWVFKKKIN